MKKKYIKPIVMFELLEDNCITLSQGYPPHQDDFFPDEHGCYCGCHRRDDPKNNFGCYNCDKCKHFNGGDHVCP